MDPVFAIIVMLIAITIYFLPAIIASNRGHHASGGIFFLNLILGWSGIIWIVCFIWAFTSGKQ